jgi:hypothetical protein
MILDLICAMNLSIVQTNAACDKPSSTGINSVHYLRISSKSKYPLTEPEALRLLAPQRGLTATGESRSKNKSKSLALQTS